MTKMEKANLADYAAKIGMRPQFIADYLSDTGQTVSNFISAVISEKIGTIEFRTCERCIMNGLPLEGVRY